MPPSEWENSKEGSVKKIPVEWPASFIPALFPAPISVATLLSCPHPTVSSSPKSNFCKVEHTGISTKIKLCLWNLPQNMASFFHTILPKLSKSQASASALILLLLPRIGNNINFRNYWESWKIWNEWNNLQSGQKEKSPTSETIWMELKFKATIFIEEKESLN